MSKSWRREEVAGTDDSHTRTSVCAPGTYKDLEGLSPSKHHPAAKKSRTHLLVIFFLLPLPRNEVTLQACRLTMYEGAAHTSYTLRATSARDDKILDMDPAAAIEHRT